MININYAQIYIKITGHADFDKKGKDIVCAGVSAIVMGAVNWFEKKDVKLTINKSKPEISIQVINRKKSNLEKLQLLIIQLNNLAISYKKNIKIKKDKKDEINIKD